MKRLILVALVLLNASVVYADENISTTTSTTKWTIGDTISELAFAGLLEIDREQTNWISKHPIIYTRHPGRDTTYVTNNEANFFIGKNASKAKIGTYFGIMGASHAAISYGLRKSGWKVFNVPLVNIWQSVTLTAQAGNDIRNAVLGVKMDY